MGLLCRDFLFLPEIAGSRQPAAYRERSSDGGVSLYWEAENEDGDGENFCCRLEKDGTVGPVCEADSEAGRRLSVLKENCLTFNGEEAYLSSSGIRRFSDGALMLSVSGSVAAAKDGSSVCVHNGYYSSAATPYLILPSDLDTLVEKGKRIVGSNALTPGFPFS